MGPAALARLQALQVIGEQWSARAHELRDLLSRNKVLFGFHPADSQEGRTLLDQVRATAEQLPGGPAGLAAAVYGARRASVPACWSRRRSVGRPAPVP